MKHWEAYYIEKDGFADQIGCNNKAEAIRWAKHLAKQTCIEFVEIRAHNGEEILDDTIMNYKK